MTKRFRLLASIAAASIIGGATAAYAGEITGPPPIDNSKGGDGRISNGNSLCSFSGLNDTPLGVGEPGDPEYDPGGQVQSYGHFMSHYDLFDPSDPDQRAGFAFPGQGCNPQRTFGTH